MMGRGLGWGVRPSCGCLESAGCPSTSQWDDGRTWQLRQATPRLGFSLPETYP